MHVKIEDWKNGWSGISVGIDPDEIDHFIELPKLIKDDPEQHFHISSDYKGTGGIGDIEIFIRSESEHNLESLGSRLSARREYQHMRHNMSFCRRPRAVFTGVLSARGTAHR